MPRAKTTSQPHYNGHSLLDTRKYSFNAKVLEKLDHILSDATSTQHKTLFMRMDVKFPQDMEIPPGNGLFSKFNASFLRSLKHKGLEPQNLWVREKSNGAHQHYHNIYTLDGNKSQSIHPHMEKAESIWARTLNVPTAKGLIDNCTKTKDGAPQKNGIILRKDDPDFATKLDDCFRWGSYLAKTNTKGEPLDHIRDWGGTETRKLSTNK